MNQDLEIKALQFSYQETTGAVTRTKTVNLIEQDIIDLYFKRKFDKNNLRAIGQVIKIGVDNDKRKYFVVLAYQYQDEENLFKIHLDEVVRVINLTHSPNPYSFCPVYNHDETAILIKAQDGVLYFSKDGEEWIASGTSGEGGGGKAYKENGTVDESSTNETVPTSKVVYDSIVELISQANEQLSGELQQNIDAVAERVGTVEETLTQTGETISGLSDSVQSINDSISGITDSISSANQRIDSLDDTVSGVQNTVSGLSDNVSSLSQTVENIQNSIPGSIDRLSEDVTNLTNFANDLSSRVNDLANEVEILKQHHDSDLYDDVVAAGYNGTREDFAAILVDLANNINNIVIAEGAPAAEPEEP